MKSTFKSGSLPKRLALVILLSMLGVVALAVAYPFVAGVSGALAGY